MVIKQLLYIVNCIIVKIISYCSLLRPIGCQTWPRRKITLFATLYDLLWPVKYVCNLSGTHYRTHCVFLESYLSYYSALRPTCPRDSPTVLV